MKDTLPALVLGDSFSWFTGGLIIAILTLSACCIPEAIRQYYEVFAEITETEALHQEVREMLATDDEAYRRYCWDIQYPGVEFLNFREVAEFEEKQQEEFRHTAMRFLYKMEGVR